MIHKAIETLRINNDEPPTNGMARPRAIHQQPILPTDMSFQLFFIS